MRATSAARRLVELSRNSAPVLFVGHGLINRLIAQELLLSGWKGPKSPGHHYWDFALYELNPTNHETNAAAEASVLKGIA
jgi:broad specificity phosphatase PhoE